jgi:hypothetical protein
VQRQLRRGECRSQSRGEVAIDLDGRNMFRARNESRRERCEARADFDDVVARSRIDRVEDSRDVVRIGEEILTEPAAGRMSFQWEPLALASAVLNGKEDIRRLMMRDSMKSILSAVAVVGLLAGCATTVEMGGPLAYYRYQSPAPTTVYRYDAAPPVVRYETVRPSVTYYVP